MFRFHSCPLMLSFFLPQNVKLNLFDHVKRRNSALFLKYVFYLGKSFRLIKSSNNLLVSVPSTIKPRQTVEGISTYTHQAVSHFFERAKLLAIARNTLQYLSYCMCYCPFQECTSRTCTSPYLCIQLAIINAERKPIKFPIQ